MGAVRENSILLGRTLAGFRTLRMLVGIHNTGGRQSPAVADTFRPVWAALGSVGRFGPLRRRGSVGRLLLVSGSKRRTSRHRL
eukprot:14971269-Alexandrium_andersonii.AAC.1